MRIFFTVLVLTFLITVDVYLVIQKLNQRIHEVDVEVREIIELYKSNTSVQESEQSAGQDHQVFQVPLEIDKGLHCKTKEFCYYGKCFTSTLRSKRWEWIPSNTLAKGDIIRLLPGELAPALIERVILRQNNPTDGLESPPSWPFYNRGSKIGNLKSDDAARSKDELLADVMQRRKRDYIYFRVEKTPYLDDINSFITNQKIKEQKNEKLLYYRNLGLVNKYSTIVTAIIWTLASVATAFYAQYGYLIVRVGPVTTIRLDEIFLSLACIQFVVPLLFRVIEAWSNALMLNLLNTLHSNRFGEIERTSTNLMKSEIPRTNVKPNRKRSTQGSCCQRLVARLTRKGLSPSQQRTRKNKRKERRKREKEKLQSAKLVNTKNKSGTLGGLNNSINQSIRGENLEDANVEGRHLSATWLEFGSYMRSGYSQSDNIVAQMSSVSIFAFIDKQGIVTENQKYIDEIAIVDGDEEKVILDLQHDPHVTDEDRVYRFEGADEAHTKNANQLKSLGLALMLARNPSETDTWQELQEVFLGSMSASTSCLPDSDCVKISQNTGFYFHHSLGRENDSQQDCACALARLIGHQQASFANFDRVRSFWQMVPNLEIDPESQDPKTLKRKLQREQENKERLCQSYEQEAHQGEGDGLLSEIKVSYPDDLSVDSMDDLLDLQKPEYIEHIQQQQMLLERKNRFNHLICTVAREKNCGSFQSFSRGEAATVFANCTDYWNGKAIVPISRKVRSNIKEIISQWETCDFDQIGFSYKPVTPDLEQEIVEGTFDRDVASSFMQKQIFLGLVALKHHKKSDAKKQIKALEAAGIRAVLFSKEGVLETKSLAQELGIDSDWNAWISLSENPSALTQRINRDGHQVLPCGIQKVKEHVANVDQIPLQLQMFCEVTEKETEQMFQIYQEHGDIVACIGNVLDSDNLHVFQQANVAVGMSIEPLNRCNRCHGRIHQALNQPPQRNLKGEQARASLLQAPTLKYTTTKLEQLSADLNQLACAFVFDANTNILCFYPVFREARRLRGAIEQSYAMVLSLYTLLLGTLCLNSLFGMAAFLSQLQVIFLMTVSIPVSGLACLARPSSNQLMKVHVVNPKYMRVLDSTVKRGKSTVAILVLAVLDLIGLKLLQFYLLSVRNGIPLSNLMFGQIDFQSVTEGTGDVDELTNFVGSVNLILDTNFTATLLVLQCISIGLEKPSQDHLWRRNRIFLIQLGAQSLCSLMYLGLQILILHSDELMLPSWQVALYVSSSLVLLLGLTWQVMRNSEETYEKDQQKLRIHFETKLGMWSPK